MKVIRESVTICMSPEDRDDMLDWLRLVHGHLEERFAALGEVETGTEDAKLMDAMGAMYRFAQRIQNATYA